MIEAFDLVEYLNKARETCDPKALFELWEDVCRRYDRREIGAYELEEMKEIILPSLKALASLRGIVNSANTLRTNPNKPKRNRA